MIMVDYVQDPNLYGNGIYTILSERVCLENLESTRHQSLEDAGRVILLRNSLQPAVVSGSVSREDRLEASSVTPIHC